MPEVDSTQLNTQRRRSERVSETLPLIVRGVDLLGQPFEERTSTIAYNLHGCRYASKHHLPKNTWVTLELPQTPERRNVRARVAWIQRPHSVRELFQIAVELESPSNIWGCEAPPADWAKAESSLSETAELAAGANLRVAETSEAGAIPATLSSFMGKPANGVSAGSPAAAASAETPLFAPAADSPLLRELRAELERHARRAVESAAAEARAQALRASENTEKRQSAAAEEFLRRWKEDLERDERAAREKLSAQLDAKQEHILKALKAEFDAASRRAHDLIAQLERKREGVAAQREAAQEAASQWAQARLQLEAAEAALASKRAEAAPQEAQAEAGRALWRESLESETASARAQWNELLQSSLDGGIRRLAEQLAARSDEILRSAETKMNDRFSELQKPFAQASESARESAARIQAALEQEVSRAWSSLAEIEHAAGRMKEHAAQLEAASQDSLNQLHRRLESILDAQTAEMNRRAEGLASGLAQRSAPALDAMGREFVERTVAEVQSKIAPHAERVPALLRELSAREVQMEESLRLHRERLRQASENSQREVSQQTAASLGDLRGSFETARKEALTKWNEELDSAGVRAAHAAGESMARSSEAFQQEARARMQTLAEQALATAGSDYERKAADAGQNFETRLAGLSSAKLSGIQQQLEGAAEQALGRTCTQLDEAAATAAASFGQVLEDISAGQAREFALASRGVVDARSRELEAASAHSLRDFEASAGSSLDKLNTKLGSLLEGKAAEGRATLAAELASALEAYRTELEARHQESQAGLERMSEESIAKYQERLQTTGDSWILSSVRRLNEHGQDAVESLMRSADQSLRDSCAKFFAGLAETLRDRPANTTSVAGFAAAPPLEAPDAKASPRNEVTSSGAGA